MENLNRPKQACPFHDRMKLSKPESLGIRLPWKGRIGTMRKIQEAESVVARCRCAGSI
jgi:hypothetical protein